MARIRSFLGVGQALGYPSPLSALPQAMNVIRSTSIDFAENQLYPILVIRIGKPGRAFPPMEPHVQVSSHTAQMTNGKSRPLAGPKLLVPAFPGLNEISALGSKAQLSFLGFRWFMKPGEMAGPFPVPSGPGFRMNPRITFVALLLAVIHPKHESVIITYEWSFRACFVTHDTS